MKKEDMNIVIVGHVDHGKSTLIGRLLADTNSLPEGKLEAVKEKCRRNAKPFEYAFLLDALKAEQEQGITIDIARCFFKTKKRDYIILDAPGHIEFLKNMITGAARADAAILVIDAKEGIKENSKRHGYMLSLLGIKQIVVAINKLDLVNYSEEKYEEIKRDYLEFLNKISIKPLDVIPISAFNGDNVIQKSKNMKWYSGKTILESLDDFKCKDSAINLDFRMPIQSVYKFTENGDNRRIIAGTVETGKIELNTDIIIYPSMKKSKINTIESFPKKTNQIATAGMTTGFTLTEQIYVKRGEVVTIANQPPMSVANKIKANIFWLGKHRLSMDMTYLLKIGTDKVKAKVVEINRIINSSDLSNRAGDFVECNEVAECIIELERPIAFDEVGKNQSTSRFVIVDGYEISGGGIILEGLENEEIKETVKIKATNIVWQPTKTSYKDRCKILKQNGKVIWFTGLSGAGKTTIATEVEKYLNQNNYAVYLLDGDNIRHGINKDLGFDEDDRNENIRRITEIAKLFQDAGLIVLVSFITPFEEMRKRAKEIIGENNIIEVYVKASIETCMKRDPKGLYKKNIENFTGIASPYETPINPDMIIDTENYTIEQCSKKVIEKVLEDNKEYLKYR